MRTASAGNSRQSWTRTPNVSHGSPTARLRKRGCDTLVWVDLVEGVLGEESELAVGGGHSGPIPRREVELRQVHPPITRLLNRCLIAARKGFSNGLNRRSSKYRRI